MSNTLEDDEWLSAIYCELCSKRNLEFPEVKFVVTKCEHKFCLPCMKGFLIHPDREIEIVENNVNIHMVGTCPIINCMKEICYFDLKEQWSYKDLVPIMSSQGTGVCGK